MLNRYYKKKYVYGIAFCIAAEGGIHERFYR
jgi:hypothetical protein